MFSKMNFHTHTHFCDGKDSPEEMVKKAISLGFSALGFSGHAYTPCEPEYSMSVENTKRYKEEVLRLKHVYKNDIEIFCGLEMDYYSEVDTDEFDFIIGSVHYLEKNGIYYAVDDNVLRFQKGVSAFGGDVYSFIEEYYRLLEEIPEKTNADIIGHFDLVTKFNEAGELFSETHPRYTAAATHAVDALLKSGRVFEINTGAMARKCRTSPYPAQGILDRIIKGGGRVILSSDCHDKEMLDFGFCEVLNSNVGVSVKKNLITYDELSEIVKTMM